MAYHIDDASVTLADLKQRIEATDLVPSRACLVDGIDSALSALGAHGITTLVELRDALKTTRRLDAILKAARRSRALPTRAWTRSTRSPGTRTSPGCSG